MTGSKFLHAAASIAFLAAQPAVGQPGSFPCDDLGSGGYRVFEGLGPPAPARASGPVRLRRNAVLASEQRLLEVRWLTLDDSNLATGGGALPPVPFRAYTIDGQRRYCTTTVREELFGPAVGPGRFLLRCLTDADDDGRYEGFQAHGELVRINARSGRAGLPTGATPPTGTLARSVRLIEAPEVRDPDPGYAPRVRAELRVARVNATEVTLRHINQVDMYPANLPRYLRDAGDFRTLTLPLREGAWTAPDGWTILLERDGRQWQATVSDSWGAQASLQCGGSVVDTGTHYVVMGDGGMAILAKAGPSGSR